MYPLYIANLKAAPAPITARFPSQKPSPAAQQPAVAIGGSIRRHPVPPHPPRRPRPATIQAPVLKGVPYFLQAQPYP